METDVETWYQYWYAFWVELGLKTISILIELSLLNITLIDCIDMFLNDLLISIGMHIVQNVI